MSFIRFLFFTSAKILYLEHTIRICYFVSSLIFSTISINVDVHVCTSMSTCILHYKVFWPSFSVCDNCLSCPERGGCTGCDVGYVLDEEDKTCWRKSNRLLTVAMINQSQNCVGI